MSDARSDVDETDLTLIQAIQQGKHEAFERFLDRHVHHVRALLALKVPVAQLVDELAHEAFVFAYRNVHEFTVGTSVWAWLRAIAWNLLRAEIQRFSREQANFAAQSICESVHAATEPCSTAEMEFLERCLEQVPASMRQLLALKYRDDCSSEEIARQLQRSVAWVYTMLFRVRQQLKECIEQKLSAVVGAPKVHRVGKRSTLNAQRSTVVHLGDRIETGDADRAEIQFRDGTTLRLNFNTTLEIPNPKSEIRNPKSRDATLQRFNASTLQRPPEVKLLVGHVWSKVQKTTNAPQFAVHTPVATALVRGTEFGLKLRNARASTNNAQRSTLNAQRSTLNAQRFLPF